MSTDNPRFPVYIVSKGRWDRRPTANMLESIGVDYFIIVEEQEKLNYSRNVKGTVLVLPQKYKDEYDCFWNDGDQRTGPGPARNYAWDHSTKNGFSHHWVLDDNIESIERFNNNMKIRCVTGKPFYIMEDYILRFKNIAQAGPGYSIFCPYSERRPPLRWNTRIYSFLLINSSIPYRWRGRYNEDTDLSIRAMKDGWCTVEFNCFLQGKRATQTVRGGNSAEFYDREGTFKKSKMLIEMHPDIVKESFKFNRHHHQVNYKVFSGNTPVLGEGVVIQNRVNNYGMHLIKKA
jgi:hypothetical protein